MIDKKTQDGSQERSNEWKKGSEDKRGTLSEVTRRWDRGTGDFRKFTQESRRGQPYVKARQLARERHWRKKGQRLRQRGK